MSNFINDPLSVLERGVQGEIEKLLIHFVVTVESHQVFPEELFILLLEMLSRNEIYNRNDLGDFSAVLYLDTHKMNASQKSQIMARIKSNYRNYINFDMCCAACECVLKICDRRTALDTFQVMMPAATRDGKEAVAYGLSILSRRANAEERARIDGILASE